MIGNANRNCINRCEASQERNRIDCKKKNKGMEMLIDQYRGNTWRL